jgi:hypothetical protein
VGCAREIGEPVRQARADAVVVLWGRVESHKG